MSNPETFQDHGWKILKDTSRRLADYTLYAAKNILTLRKSQVDAKLDRNLQNVVNENVMDINLLADKYGNIEIEREDFDKKDKEELNYPNVDM